MWRIVTISLQSTCPSRRRVGLLHEGGKGVQRSNQSSTEHMAQGGCDALPVTMTQNTAVSLSNTRRQNSALLLNCATR